MARSGVFGDREVVAALNALGKSLTVGIVDPAVKEALEPMRAQVEQNARSHISRRLGRNIANKWGIKRTVKRGNRYRYLLGAIGGAIRVAHLFEFGIAFHSMYPGARRRENLYQDRPPFYKGRAATPIVRPAFDMHRSKVPERLGIALFRHIEKQAITSAGRLRRRR